MGFTLAEIKHLLTLRADKDERSCAEVKEYTAQKLIEIEARIRDLQVMQQAIKSASHCSILTALECDDLDDGENA